MRNFSLFTIAIMAATLFMGMSAHKFYFSRTLIEENNRENRIEITMRFFTDDLERALSTEEKKIHFADDPYDPLFNHEVEQYIRNNFEIQINAVPRDYVFLGKQVESDITWCYMEINGFVPVNTLKVTNTCMFDLFSDQVNEVDIKFGGRQQRMTLVANRPSDLFHN